MKPQSTKDHHFYAAFKPETSTDQPGCIGLYTFNLLGRDAQGELTAIPLYGMRVRLNDHRVTFAYDGGDAPSAKAGRALDLHQAATALLRSQAPDLVAPVAFFVDDAGKVGCIELGEFLTARVPTFAHDLPSLIEGSAALQPGAGLTCPPSPPSPSF